MSKKHKNNSLWPDSDKLKAIARMLEENRIMQGHPKSSKAARKWMYGRNSDS
jgi:hypothetical protein